MDNIGGVFLKTNLILSTVNQLLEEINKVRTIKENKVKKYKKELKIIMSEYEKIDIEENLKKQYNQLNSKGIELLQGLRNNKKQDKMIFVKKYKNFEWRKPNDAGKVGSPQAVE